jgi:hypothetical protein
MKSAIVFGMIGLGVLLLFASGVWSSLQPGTSSWTNEKDVRLSEVSDKMHMLTAKVATAEARPSMHGGPDLPKAKAELAALVEENKTLMNEFKGIQARPHTMSKVMKWTGISLTLVGIVGWYAINQSR